jgi:hypothetical protein
MPFRPKVNEVTRIGNTEYRFNEHPSAKGMPYGQTGRRATVYQLQDVQGGLYALKVFTLAFRTPQTEEQAVQIAPYAGLPGMAACSRQVFSPEKYAGLVSAQPDLRYAVLMPWMQGATWQELLIKRHPLTRGQSLMLAENLLKVLAILEGQGIAHCDLSGPNIMVDPGAFGLAQDGTDGLALVDLEDMYAPTLWQPEKLPAGSAGYAHRTAEKGLWSPQADRFAGSVLLAEMLGWCDRDVREAACGEQYFDLAEVQEPCERYEALVTALEDCWGPNAAGLFVRAWNSATLEECPAFAEWSAAMKVDVPQVHIARQEVASHQTQSADSPVKGWRTFTGNQVSPQNGTPARPAKLVEKPEEILPEPPEPEEEQEIDVQAPNPSRSAVRQNVGQMSHVEIAILVITILIIIIVIASQGAM